MIRKFLLPALAVVGLGIAIFTVVAGSKATVPAPAVADPAQPPYRAFVAGSGIVEASTENIAIGTQLPGIVSRIYIQIGSPVKAGDPLFTIDDRAQRAELATRRASVQVAEAQLADSKNQLALAESITDKRAMSVEERDKRRFATQKAEAQLAQAGAELKAMETDLDRLTVRAPVDGQILQLKVHLGEFAPAGVLATPLILLGNVDKLCVRVDVDENDAWRVRDRAPATGNLRGNKDIKTQLEFVRFEPYIVPKKSLTGDSSERVDTRVLQVVYGFKRGSLPIYVGQQMDVFIDAAEQNVTIAATKGARP
jgi:RND family efflux transporter MFP subunit